MRTRWRTKNLKKSLLEKEVAMNEITQSTVDLKKSLNRIETKKRWLMEMNEKLHF